MLLLRNHDSRFEIAGDKAQFDRIVMDIRDNGGDSAPSDHWNWNLGDNTKGLAGYTSELFESNYSRLNKMLDPWVGVTGMQVFSQEAVTKYEHFLRPIDHMQLLPADILAHPARVRLALCEVGGGYGRLAEVFLEKLGTRMHYVMIDAVPGSLMYAYSYLKSQYSEMNIGSFYAGDEYDTSYDCYILPSWRTGVLQQGVFDICINIESMQEMQQYHVDFYLKLFDRLMERGGHIYLSNARDYVFKGQWKIPPHWETLYLNNTP